MVTQETEANGLSSLDDKSSSERRNLYNRWRNMLRRCHNPRSQVYHYYGGRGICVCALWRTSFDAFLEWVKVSGYRPELSIERENNDGPYCPENCVWATREEQGSNKRNNVLVTAFGETKTVASWLRDPRISISRPTYFERRERGWTAEDALLRPALTSGGQTSADIKMMTLWGETRSMHQWAQDSRSAVSYYCLNHRIKGGWLPEEALTTPSRRKKGRQEVLKIGY